MPLRNNTAKGGSSPASCSACSGVDAELAGCRNIIQAAKEAGCENEHQIIGFLARQVLDLRATRPVANDGQKEALWHIADIMREHDNQGKNLLIGSTAFKSVKRWANSGLNADVEARRNGAPNPSGG